MQVLDDLDAWSALLFSYDGCNGFLIRNYASVSWKNKIQHILYSNSEGPMWSLQMKELLSTLSSVLVKFS